MSETTDRRSPPPTARAPARDGAGPRRSPEAPARERPSANAEAGCRELRDPLGDFSEQTGAHFG